MSLPKRPRDDEYVSDEVEQSGIGPLLYQIDYYRKTATASTVRVTNELVDQWESDGVARRAPSGLVRLSLALTLGTAPQSGAA